MDGRERDPRGGQGYTEDMTEETLAVKEQERQERQHRQERRRGQQADDDGSSGDRDDPGGPR
ncbi:hypothetical protein AF335_14860 [Streptomyces eurocidicus]|uniref:Uncharacterized protein n=1 Tax=Streptomyces eurocidicus TaxID=66423 RepID=A0A2N8NVK4_STREU|nr:hypothetical protein [Streptomyces eurocidicus]MBB5122303.1 hypothetical protein [Streptomyces eurocidicus]MBF6055183.1 hypothetical protein [Streptomyces eurocidicus]PNE32816.1 hypothetical protein AF335_14860 [Streptomyces eurocidicus]